MSASDLDWALPNLPFVDWFDKIIGPKAGVVWQLTECGEQIVAPGQKGQDWPACAEVNAILPDGRKVFVVISVGTFKKGVTGKPSFFRAVVEQNEHIYQVHRLSDLPAMLRSRDDISATDAKKQVADLPTIKTGSMWIIAPFRYLAPPPSIAPPPTGGLGKDDVSPAPPRRPSTGGPGKDDASPAPPPTPSTGGLGKDDASPAPPLTPSTAPAQAPEKVTESELQSRALTKIKPAYPPTAKKMNATGTVEVEVTISEAGLVVEATAISGHMALRSAAVDAARKWVFNPAILNGAPVRMKSVLTFVFAPSAK
jgi:protein TonB